MRAPAPSRCNIPSVIRRLACLAVLLSTACAPSSPSPLKVKVLQNDPANPGKFTLGSATLNTVKDLAHLAGTPGSVYGGVSIRVDPNEIKTPSVDDIRKTITKDAGSPYKFGFFVSDGEVWPETWHDLAAVTTYYNFERAYGFFHTGLDLDPGSPGPLQIDYWADVTLVQAGQTPKPERDNAAYYPLLQHFWVYPFDQLHDIPLSMNGGVVAHEYSHAVLNHELFKANPMPPIFQTWSVNRSLNVFKSMDEGFADLFAAEAVGDENFIASSVPQIAEYRHLDQKLCYSTSTVSLPGGSVVDIGTYSTNTTADTYDPYALGTIISSTIWAVAQTVSQTGGDRSLVFKAVLEAERKLGDQIDNSGTVAQDGTGYDLDLIADALGTAASDLKVHAIMCRVLKDRWAPKTLQPNSVRSCNAVPAESLCPHP